MTFSFPKKAFVMAQRQRDWNASVPPLRDCDAAPHRRKWSRWLPLDRFTASPLNFAACYSGNSDQTRKPHHDHVRGGLSLR